MGNSGRGSTDRDAPSLSKEAPGLGGLLSHLAHHIADIALRELQWSSRSRLVVNVACYSNSKDSPADSILVNPKSISNGAAGDTSFMEGNDLTSSGRGRWSGRERDWKLLYGLDDGGGASTLLIMC